MAAASGHLSDLRSRLAAELLGAIESVVVPDLVAGLIAGEGTTIWFGDGGVGKSILALLVAFSVALGRPLLAGMEAATAEPVIWLDFEHRRRTTRLRAGQISGDLRDVQIDYVPGKAPIWSMTALVEYVRVLKPALIVIDSLGRAVEGMTLDPTAVARFYDMVDAFDCPVLVLAHVSRQNTDLKPFGLNAWHDGARATFLLRKGRRPGHFIEIVQRKANDGELHTDPFRFEIVREPNRTSLRPAARPSDGPATLDSSAGDCTAEAIGATVERLYSELDRPVQSAEILVCFALRRSRFHELLGDAVKQGYVRPNGRSGRASAYLPGRRSRR